MTRCRHCGARGHHADDTMPTEPSPLAVVDGIEYAPGGAYAACLGKAARVREYVETYRDATEPGEDIATVLADMLADLQHYAAIVGADWDETTRRAAEHVEAERMGE